MTRPTIRTFPIIGIGASAGGLEALEKFLAPVPENCGHAFVIVQHLEPTHQTQLAELLQRVTKLPVAYITDGLVVERNHVYIIPPGRDLAILQGVLQLVERSTTRGVRLPIDSFLRSLANDRREFGIGVILSGMGTDGTLGLRAIRELGGATFVQSPETAQFDSMPRSAVTAGVADVIARAEELHARIVEFLGHGLPVRADSNPPPVDDDLPEGTADAESGSADGTEYDGVGQVILLVRSLTGHDFSRYKRSTLTRRIERRMGLHRIASLKEYVRFLRDDPDEPGLLFAELLIGVTRFFRDPDSWKELAETALPALLAARPEGGPLRAWTPGCSTGEEAYSLAMTFREAIDASAAAAPFTLQIFATDLDPEAVAKARNGVYPSTIAADVSDERLKRFFVVDDAGYRVRREIRESVVFAPQNLVMDPPFTRLDLLLCRNLLIYLSPSLHRTLIPLFHHALKPDGLLMLGSAETIGNWTELFVPVAPKSCIYKRAVAGKTDRRREIPVVSPHALITPADTARRRAGERDASISPSADPESTLQKQTDRMFLDRLAPIAVVVDKEGAIAYSRGATGRYLDPAKREVGTLLVQAMQPPLGAVVEAALGRSMSEGTTVELDHTTADAEPRTIRVTVEPMPATDAPAGSRLITFRDLSPDAIGAGGDDAAVSALAEARRQTQTTQMELQATNEELQSANEELITSKEEMQSMNEELQTVNHELQSKLDELTLASTDMSNLLNSTSIATLFLDPQLMVRRFTTPTTQIIRLIPGDVGRPITDIVSALDFPDIVEKAREVQKSLVVFEREVAATGGRWFVVRIMPYRTHDDRIDGVVLTFTDVSPAKRLEAALREAQSKMEGKIATQAAALAATDTPTEPR